jgi:hypothetical protein
LSDATPTSPVYCVSQHYQPILRNQLDGKINVTIFEGKWIPAGGVHIVFLCAYSLSSRQTVIDSQFRTGGKTRVGGIPER